MEGLASQFWPTAGPLIVLLLSVLVVVLAWVYRDDRERVRRERERDRKWLQRLEDHKASRLHVEGVHTDLKDSLDDVRNSVRHIERILIENRGH